MVDYRATFNYDEALRATECKNKNLVWVSVTPGDERWWALAIAFILPTRVDLWCDVLRAHRVKKMLRTHSTVRREGSESPLAKYDH